MILIRQIIVSFPCYSNIIFKSKMVCQAKQGSVERGKKLSVKNSCMRKLTIFQLNGISSGYDRTKLVSSLFLTLVIFKRLF